MSQAPGSTRYERVLAAMMWTSGRSTLAALRTTARWGQRLGAWGPTAGDFRALLPHLTVSQARVAAADSAALRAANRAEIATVWNSGIEALVPYVAPDTQAPALLRSGRGVIGVAFHVGSHYGALASYLRWGLRVHRQDRRLLGRADARARVLKAAVDAVRAGEFVPTVLDAPEGEPSEPFACLGRRLVVRRGPLTLARLTGAPVVPVLARWTPRGIDVEFGEQIDTGGATGQDVERAVALGAGRWLEGVLARRPGELWPFALRDLLAAPRVGDAG